MNQVIRQIIGRVVWTTSNIWNNLRASVDTKKPDYAWWDQFRRGEKKGFRLSGLLAKPAAEIMASWVLGDGIDIRLQTADEYTDTLLNRWSRRILSLLIQVIVDLYGLGDQYVIVNPDGSLSVPSPETVDAKYSTLDHRRLEKVTILNKLDKAELVDEYRLDGRTIRVKNTSKEPLDTPYGIVGAGQEISWEFENLIGRIPVVHFANERSANETHGRPMYEALYEWFSWYDDLLQKALVGAKRLSNPILAFVGLDDPAATKRANESPEEETYADEDGTERTRDRTEVDEDTPVMYAGKGGDAKFIGPGIGFTTDIRNMLKVLYLLFMEHLHLPDVVMGFEMSAARASAVEQIKTFFAHITFRRVALEGVGTDDTLGLGARGGLLELTDIWLRMRALTDSRVVIGPVDVSWPELSDKDAKLTKEWADSMHQRGVITDEMYVSLSERVEDPAGEIEKAREETNTDPYQRDENAGAADEDPLMDNVA
ncbi:MAG: hypothetical protein K8L99_02510 [Anaerolineae bacterium]|nr:hypothetical protein [Anaerolineae bacterium]